MPKWVRLLEALENPKKYGDIYQVPIDYIPDIQTDFVVQEKQHYGSSCPNDIVAIPKYYPTLLKGKVYLVSSQVTIQELSLNDEKTAIKKIQDDAVKYGNASLKAKGVDWNEETIGILDVLPKFLKNIAGWYWTTIPCASFDEKGRFICGLKLVSCGKLHGETNFGVLRQDEEFCTTLVPVRPLIQIMQDVLVDVEWVDYDTPLPIKLLDKPQIRLTQIK